MDKTTQHKVGRVMWAIKSCSGFAVEKHYRHRFIHHFCLPVLSCKNWYIGIVKLRIFRYCLQSLWRTVYIYTYIQINCKYTYLRTLAASHVFIYWNICSLYITNYHTTFYHLLFFSLTFSTFIYYSANAHLCFFYSFAFHCIFYYIFNHSLCLRSLSHSYSSYYRW